MKSTILLTTALFLISAPSPDSKTISEISGGFLAETDSQGLMAAESAGAQGPTQGSSVYLADAAPVDGQLSAVEANGQVQPSADQLPE